MSRQRLWLGEREGGNTARGWRGCSFLKVWAKIWFRKVRGPFWCILGVEQEAGTGGSEVILFTVCSVKQRSWGSTKTPTVGPYLEEAAEERAFGLWCWEGHCANIDLGKSSSFNEESKTVTSTALRRYTKEKKMWETAIKFTSRGRVPTRKKFAREQLKTLIEHFPRD